MAVQRKGDVRKPTYVWTTTSKEMDIIIDIDKYVDVDIDERKKIVIPKTITTYETFKCSK
jgi:hypothetical protein